MTEILLTAISLSLNSIIGTSISGMNFNICSTHNKRTSFSEQKYLKDMCCQKQGDIRVPDIRPGADLLLIYRDPD